MSSNKNDVLISAYNQATADFIAIFWKFHKKRLDLGNIQFGRQDQGGNGLPLDEISQFNQFSLHRYAEDVTKTLNTSFRQFSRRLLGISDPVPRNLFWKEFPIIPDECQKFFTTYVAELALEGKALLNEYRPALPFGTRIMQGVGTGSEVTTRMEGLYGSVEDSAFVEKSALMGSKIGLGHISALLARLDIEYLQDPSDDSYSHEGISREMLKELDLGYVLGCPAGRRPSKAAKDFLDSIDEHPGEVVIVELARALHQDFQRMVRPWHEGLPKRDRKKLIRADELSLLNGEAWRGRKQLMCPYSGKERR